MSAKTPSLAAATEAAVSQSLKTWLQLSNQDDRARKGLGFVIEMVSLSAGYVIHCMENNKAADGDGLVTYLAKKSTAIAKMIDVQSLQCVASIADFGMSVGSDVPVILAGTATAASGVSVLLAIRAGLALLMSAKEVWTHCSPLVKAYVDKVRNQVALERIVRESIGKLKALNYQPNEEIARTA